ncbi:MAG: SusD/RagB family nutrient-binding outer membrane lipoprotein [Flavobacteriaceae bacterium]|nr:SusD/RagB family nutrient-binding outer membrane lipoprotein [Flavobacteriaceae bacterium]
MKKIYIKSIFIALFSFLLISCETTELNLQDNPNEVTPETASARFLFNSVQLQFEEFLGNEDSGTSESLNSLTLDYTRMTQVFGSYAYETARIDNIWTVAYNEVFQDALTLIPIAEAEGLSIHAGATRVLQAYTLTTLVDLFGDIPFSEANLGGANTNPKLDAGNDVYAAALSILDEAIVNLLDDSAPNIDNDLYFTNGDRENWLKVANTLKLKIFLQTRLANESASRNGINALLQSDNLINNASDDFAFNYLDVVTPNDSRHPIFVANYNDGSGEFMSNWYMKQFLDNNDPRIRYYFYRQQTSDPNASDIPCDALGNVELCYIGDGYFGRDHGDNTFTTSGMFQRNTTWGVYPIGGKFDDDSEGRTSFDDGAQGAGIRPILLSSYTNFMKAEAALTLGTTGNAGVFLEDGIRQSITKTISFGTLGENSDTDFRPSQEDIDIYVSGIMTAYNNASSTGKLNIIVRQYMFAAWGNGMEAYNVYRRTGSPSGIQSPDSDFPMGTFPRSFQYPAIVVALNQNVNQQSFTNQVFWDTNAANFID